MITLLLDLPDILKNDILMKLPFTYAVLDVGRESAWLLFEANQSHLQPPWHSLQRTRGNLTSQMVVRREDQTCCTIINLHCDYF